MASATEQQRLRITASSLLRQLEQQPAEGTSDHLATLKRQATAKHVQQLLNGLEGSSPSAALVDLQARLTRITSTLSTPPPPTPSTPAKPRPTYIPTLSPSSSSALAAARSDPNSPHYDPYAPPIEAPGPLDFLLPEKPSLPLSLSRPGSRAGSPAPSHSNLLRNSGYEPPRSYSPTPSSGGGGGVYDPYTPLSSSSLRLPRPTSPLIPPSDPYAPPPRGGGGSDTSLSPTRSTHQPRERRKSTAGGPDDDYEPDAYSPVRERSRGSVDLRRSEEDEGDEEIVAAGESSMIDHGSSYGGMDDGDVDPEAGLGEKPDFPADEEEDPEAGIGMAAGDDDEEDPEAFLPPPSQRPHSTSVSSTRSTTSSSTKAPPPPPSTASSKSALAPPPPRRGSLSPTVSITPPPSSGIRSRRATARPSALRSRSSDHQQDRDDLLSGAPATSSDLLSHQHDLQSHLLGSLTSLSSQLKSNSQTFSSNLEKDAAVLQGAKEKLEVNHERMIKEGGRLKEGKKRQRGTLCWTVGVVGAVAVAWVGMFLLIKVT